MNFSDFFKNNKKLILIIICALGITALICAAVFIPKMFMPADTDADGGNGEAPALSDTFGVLFDGKVPSDNFGNNSENDSVISDFQGTISKRPEENDEIPFKSTKLYHALDHVDIHYVYMQSICSTLSNTGYMQQKLVYAINGNDIYIRQTVGTMQNHFLSDGENLYGLDFDERTYTVISSEPYKASDLIYIDNYDHCTSMGRDIFCGIEYDYEDYTVSVAPQNEWIRYYFKEDGSMAGYERYVEQELQEIMYYEYFGSEFPEEAVVFFDIPADFTEYDNIVEYSELFGDDPMELD